MAPLQIQDIIREAQENHAADGKERTYQGHKLGEARASHSSTLFPLHHCFQEFLILFVPQPLPPKPK